MARLRTGGPFPLADSPTRRELASLGFEIETYPWIRPQKIGFTGLMAVWTGEKRSPRKGEWFLSGAIVEAYRAVNDLEQSYHIARLVRTRTTLVTTVENVEQTK